MKPKYRRFLTAGLPCLIIIPAMAQLAHAAVIPDNPNGDVTVTATVNATNSGANSVNADGGLSANPLVNILTGANLTGNAGSLFVVQTSNANYTITNDGTIAAGPGVVGINVLSGGGIASVVNNTGTISSVNSNAITSNLAAGAFTLNNSGLIQSSTNAFVGSAANDTLNLNLGSRVIGNVTGGLGIDTINFRAGLSAPGGINNSISGNVTGFEAVNKNLGGVAFIGRPSIGATPADPLYIVNANAITIQTNGGGLYINGNINAADGVSQSTINSGGTALGGTGLWNANVNVTAGGFSAGAIPINLDVVPANAVGTVTITGDVTHVPPIAPLPGTFIRYDVNPGAAAQSGVLGSGVTPTMGVGGINVSGGTTADLIAQTGLGNTYNVNGAGLRISNTDNNRAISNGTYVIVDSAAGIDSFPTIGAISSQLNPNVNALDTGIRGSEIVVGGGATNNANTVLARNFSTLSLADGGTNLVLTINHDFSALATNPNAAAIGNALDASINSPNANIQDFIGALDNSNLAAVQATLNGLSPDATFSTAVALASGNYRLNRLVQDHLALTRAGGDSVRSYVGSYSEPATAPAPQVQNAGVGNVWGNVSYAWKEIDSNFGNDFDGEEAAFTAGFDYRVSQDLLIGLVLDGSTGDYDYTGGSSDVDSFRAAIYGTYGQATGIYADFLAGYGSHNIDLNRNGGILGGINSDTDADSLQAMITVGYAMQSGSVKHGPFGGIEYQNIDVDGYTQGGPLPIAVSGYDVDSLRLLGGYRVEASYGRFSPYASVAYAHELEDDAINTTAILPGGAGFGATGSGLESSILISVGANYALTESLTLTGGYLGELSVGGDGTDSHGASLGLNYAF